MMNKVLKNPLRLIAATTLLSVSFVASANDRNGQNLSLPVFGGAKAVQLAAGPNYDTNVRTSNKRVVKKTIKEIEADALNFKRYDEVPLNMSAPASARVNKPFVTVFRFRSPVKGFNKDKIKVENGRVTYFAGNSYSTTYHALIVANSGLDKVADNRVNVTVSNTASGWLSKSVKILPAAVDKSTLESVEVASLEPHGYFNLLLSRGGDSVDVDHSHRIGDTMGAQIGFSYPLPETKTQLDKILPRGSVRLVLGYERMEDGSKSSGDYAYFSTTTADLLYDVRFTEHWNILAGGTMGQGGSLKAQKLSLRDLPGERDGTVDFESSYGFKFIMEYYPLKTEYVDLFVDFGFTVIDYIPKKVVLNDSSVALSSPTRVGASSFKLGFGLRI